MEREFPYEYGSDLHWLWGWGQRIADSDEKITGPNLFAPMYFRPDRLAANALAEFTPDYGPIVRQIQDYLDHADVLFQQFVSDSSMASWEAFCLASGDLAERIFQGCKVIAKSRAQSQSPKVARNIASEVDKERLRFHDQKKRENRKLTQKEIALLWEKETRTACDPVAFKQSLYRARKQDRQ